MFYKCMISLGIFESRRFGTKLVAAAYSLSLSLAIAGGAWAQGAPNLKEAASLISSGNAAQALTRLSPFEDSHAGDSEFDYLHGLAALESGDAAKATVALERVLIVNPSHAGARVDLARAYFALGDLARARSEFNIALAQNPPPAVRTMIDNHLARIDQGAAPGGVRFTGYVDVAAGRDSNVNNATVQAQVYVPVFGFNVQLAPTSQRTPDTFASLGAGGELTYTLNTSTSLFVAGDARLRWNRSADTFAYNQYDVRAGVQHAFGAAKVLRVALTGQQYELDQRRYRTATGINAEWRQSLSDAAQLSLFGVGYRMRYKDDAQEPNDADLGMLGAGYTHVLNAARRASVSASLFAGYERDVGQRLDGDRKLLGLRIGGQLAMGANLDVYAGVGYQPSDFQTRNIVFDVQRRDRQTDAAVGLAWRFDRAWTLRPQIAYTQNRSNVSIYTYDRYEVSLMLRRDFK